jgi:uncharacterized protein YqeY
MSNLLNQIKADQLVARKARDTVKSSLLTTLIGEASFVSEQDYKAGKTEITDEKVLATIRKFLKGAVETLRLLLATNSGVIQPIQTAKIEIDILESYIPQQLSEDELRMIIVTFKEANPGANVGAIMGYLKTNHAGLYDGKMASALAK